ncbi:dynein cytoplasmic 2 light intermediate chain [Marchantia polymorpha subsp. ruderalis]|uniref:Cytoplasmic dynein 2 light intermediate chain 1 n=2 Tax=Marchantia polymorpha TaxID=3197 RepID=A0AAF6BBI0_MARPO|nr:hypothetical protein MARPO_0169s0025 [Marchantia polymorpha]BBN09364.1 hypothetical protein Mp_4g19190 [Marchantia polymorpha subsp. ruderalis]|eukprot:PTQ28265.1 hypothetical protein MARPO_0169s0025 [Marchantia polymorpha]
MGESENSSRRPSSSHGRLSSKDNARPPPGTGGKDIWTIISEKKKADAHSGGGDRPDAHILVVGSPRGGKSTLIARYLNPEKEDVPKRTIGLEYTFARRTVSSAVSVDRKDVVHIWELSGPRKLEEELLTAERLLLPMSSLSTSVVVVVLDLSKPSEVLDLLIFWLDKIHKRIEGFYEKLKRRGSKLPQQLVEREKKLFGLEHEDLDEVKLSGVPVIIVGTKYDCFKVGACGLRLWHLPRIFDQDAELRKTMARTLRYLAHTNGGTLLYTTGLNKDVQGESRSSHSAFRSIINHLVFHAPPYRGVEVDHSRPLVIPLGLDRLANIGHPSGKDDWISHFLKLFPSPGKGPVASRKNENNLHPEKEIDDLIAQCRAQPWTVRKDDAGDMKWKNQE